MSHYHCEVVIPPTDDIEAAVASVLAPFDESPDEANEDQDDRNAFWDFYVIGGRFAGNKMLAKYDMAKLEAFEAWLRERGTTVQGLLCGKPELSPASQAAEIDAKWNESFPSDPPIPCPLFAHSNDQYGRNGRGRLPEDVLPLAGVPERLRVSRVIFAAPSYSSETNEHTGPLKANFMLCDSKWNGCNHMPIKWDGSIADALTQYRKNLSCCKEEYAAKVTPTDEWLCVTVDYHS